MPQKSSSAVLPVSYASALTHERTDKRVEILRLTGETGSISQAARDAGISYKAAWQAIDTLTNLAGTPLVKRAVGGTGGGGAKLTPAGYKLLAVAGRLNETRHQVLDTFKADELPSHAMPSLSGISMRTSMRNQLPCEVQRLEVRGQVARVHLALAHNALLISRITKDSAELLGLQKGQKVLALCKATAVSVNALNDATGPRNTAYLSGQVVRISRGNAGDEISMQLDSGLQLVGFAAPRSALKTKARVSAMVDEAAWVIALPT